MLSQTHPIRRPAASPPARAAAPPPHAVPSSGGQALDHQTNRTMSERFGHNFSSVRIHSGAQAGQSAEAMGANAYTFGSDIVFGNAKYQPGSRETDRLLAHELTHVVQQTRSGPGDTARASQRSDNSEREADLLSKRVLAGESVQVTAAPDAAIARDDASQTCSADDADANMSIDPNASAPNSSPAPAGPQPFYPTYNEAAYGIMNSCADPSVTAQSLVNAANTDLAGHGMPPVGLGTLPAGDTNLGEGNFQKWTLDVNPAPFNTETPDHQARPMEDRADAANTVAHEAYHEYQWYEMARLQAGLGPTPGGPLNQIDPGAASRAAADPILQCDDHTTQVQEWYDSVYGAGAPGRNQTLTNLGTPNENIPAYCALPEERDAWTMGRETTESFRQTDGVPDPDAAHDRSVCSH